MSGGMTFDVFFSICQTPVDGYQPSERVMFENFFSQAILADRLGFGTAWVAETHLSSQVQKLNPDAVIPEFEGEIGLNTDILMLAQRLFYQTKNIYFGSAIRNIQCNGGPIAHAEAVRMFLTLQSLEVSDSRRLCLGFAAGRFPYSNIPYGIRPRNEFERRAWPIVRTKIFSQATEIFLRLLRGETVASQDLAPQFVGPEDFKQKEAWLALSDLTGGRPVEVFSPWQFDKLKVIPAEAPLDNLDLFIGSHDPQTQAFANSFMPVGVFNLSITPNSVIQETHSRMQKQFNSRGGPWHRRHMPRTALVFVCDDGNLSEAQKHERARAKAQHALANYWKALEGTVSPERIDQAVDNALVGSPRQIYQQVRERFDAEDRLMLWFDFNNHNNDEVKKSMEIFMHACSDLARAPTNHERKM